MKKQFLTFVLVTSFGVAFAQKKDEVKKVESDTVKIALTEYQKRKIATVKEQQKQLQQQFEASNQAYNEIIALIIDGKMKLEDVEKLINVTDAEIVLTKKKSKN